MRTESQRGGQNCVTNPVLPGFYPDPSVCRRGEDYYLAVFLVGAYQEPLGDLHNLFGDTNVVNVAINPDGSFDFVREFQGDSIADVLSYVEYEPKHLQEEFRRVAENAVREGRISVAERQTILQAFRESLHGYTYFEQH